MDFESKITERVDFYLRHPVFEHSDEVMEEVLRDLESKAVRGQIGRETYERLRDRILGSPHLRRKAG